MSATVRRRLDSGGPRGPTFFVILRFARGLSRGLSISLLPEIASGSRSRSASATRGPQSEDTTNRRISPAERMRGCRHFGVRPVRRPQRRDQSISMRASPTKCDATRRRSRRRHARLIRRRPTVIASGRMASSIFGSRAIHVHFKLPGESSSGTCLSTSQCVDSSQDCSPSRSRRHCGHRLVFLLLVLVLHLGLRYTLQGRCLVCLLRAVLPSLSENEIVCRMLATSQAAPRHERGNSGQDRAKHDSHDRNHDIRLLATSAFHVILMRWRLIRPSCCRRE
mmetsp:Transcript_8353/g.25923  ORF Transcript_8353/g.25923 Transcript_8353/m.25923 type:complete len:280 (-) Transcript_8353:1505-2344(-)